MVPDKILNTVLGVFYYFCTNLHPRKVFKNEYGLIKCVIAYTRGNIDLMQVLQHIL